MNYVETPKAPKPIGPYSQGIVANGMVFVSGMIGTDPVTGAIVEGGIREQTRRVLENLKAVLEQGGSGLDRVLKVTVFLKDGSQFKDMNDVYATYFGSHKPTRTTVVVGFAKDGLLVEIDCIASL